MNHEIQHRQETSRLIYALWTLNGSDETGLAAPLLDGRIDALGIYVSFADEHDDDDGDDDCASTMHTTTVDCRSCSNLAYQEFLETCMLPNKPVMIQGLTKTWKSARKWVDDKGEPDLLKLASLFGNDVAPVHVQSQAGFSQTRPQKEEWTVQDYALWWYEHHEDPQQEQQLLYLKDYMFVAAHPDYHAYEWPIYFQDDWLNGYTENAYKFVYLGPKGTSTRLHADVLRSYSWSTNVCGIKRWYLIPPEYTHLLYDVFSRHLASHLQCTDTVMYPGLAKARKHAIEVIQQAGETLFVPSGWHHTVENLAPTLSINHNWLNGANIRWSWEKLRTELEGLSSKETETIIGETLMAETVGPSDSSQIGDDLLLLWKVLSTKARSVIEIERKSMTEFNLNACLPVLKEISAFVKDGKDQGLTERCHCDIDDLIRDIENYLDSPPTSS
jgi:hypothetical protein